MPFKKLALPLLSLLLISCGGGGGSDSPKEPPQPTAPPPVVTLSVDSASIDESSTIVITHSAKDYQDTTITSELNCDVGTLDGNNYTAPSVSTETTATCTATATDNGNRSTTETLSLTINALTPALALANGVTSATTAKLTTIDVSFADVSEGLIDATLNGEAIKLGVTSDRQLVYFPSFYASGTQTLIIELEGEAVTYQYNATPSIDIISDTSAYVTNYIIQVRSEVDEKIAIAQSKGISSTEIEKLNDIKNSFDVSLISELTRDEVDLLAYLIYQNISKLYADENTVNSNAYYGKSNYSLMSAKNSLSSCESTAALIVASGGTAYLTTSATLALAATGAGIPVASATILGAAVSWNVLIHSVDRMGELCFEWAETDLDNINSFEKQNLTARNTSIKLSTPIKTTKVENGTVDFFHNEERTFVATRKYQILTGAENHVTSIINAVNKVRGPIIELVNLIGENNTPAFLLSYIENPVDINDYLYEQIDPSFLTMSSISSADVDGYMIVDGNSFDLNFDIQDLDIGHVPFQFSLTDSSINGTTVIDAEVTLNPPIAYSETFVAVIGEDMTARLQADFETGFEIKTPPQFGTLDLSPSFNYPGGGLFTYTSDETITEDTTDTFTFVATNGSSKNNGESNIATVTLQFDKCTTSIHSDHKALTCKSPDYDIYERLYIRDDQPERYLELDIEKRFKVRSASGAYINDKAIYRLNKSKELIYIATQQQSHLIYKNFSWENINDQSISSKIIYHSNESSFRVYDFEIICVYKSLAQDSLPNRFLSEYTYDSITRGVIAYRFDNGNLNGEDCPNRTNIHVLNENPIPIEDSVLYGQWKKDNP
ncbi:hypothetical protein [Colwellia echini]|uniref:Uncharacterized protein n=1 Tax=Colwellia echini TaxID=1982103 RepID=A0ABY3MTX0_9GAMM|nr:hypothetical protein [Colwellia echini]TYK64638.1 hypothetical protein CWS31_014380 [Colwellia echini]